MLLSRTPLPCTVGVPRFCITYVLFLLSLSVSVLPSLWDSSRTFALAKPSVLSSSPTFCSVVWTYLLSVSAQASSGHATSTQKPSEAPRTITQTQHSGPAPAKPKCSPFCKPTLHSLALFSWPNLFPAPWTPSLVLLNFVLLVP